MLKLQHLLLLSTFFLFGISINAQSDFQKVYTLLQTKCANASCHGGANPQGNLDLGANLTSVFNSLVNKAPTNPAAAAKGQLLVQPGRPDLSYLLRKVAYDDWDDYYESLEVAEGNQMPPGALPDLQKHEVELIRQWILHGAAFNSNEVDTDILEAYYTSGGLDFVERPDPPLAGEGFQLRFGPIFLAPNEEIEYFRYFDPELPDNVEVHTIDMNMNDESHHFLLYELDLNAPVPGWGLININEAFGIDMGDENMVAGWQLPHEWKLPQHTAYFWDENTRLNLNFHIKNYSASAILPGDVYLNVYTQESGTAQERMYAQLFPIGATSGNNLVIPNGGNEITITDAIKTNSSYPIYIWSLSSHTHQTGTDYDIYLREWNGSKGDQIYEGFFNFDYTFNQGFFDWEHPPIRNFEEPLFVDLQKGLIHEAKYINDTDDYLYWGVTTEDEMMLFYVHYTLNAVTDTEEIENEASIANSFSVSPNPFSDFTNIHYQLRHAAEVRLEIFDVLGNHISTILDQTQSPGFYNQEFRPERGIANGLYVARLSIDGTVFAKKFSYLGK